MNNHNTKRTHRIGSISCGIALILFGILFLVHIFVPMLSYRFIFRLWPCIFIMMGLELLIGNYLASRRKDASTEPPVSIVYDKGAVFLLILLLIFAMCMAAADECANYVTLRPSVTYVPYR